MATAARSVRAPNGTQGRMKQRHTRPKLQVLPGGSGVASPAKSKGEVHPARMALTVGSAVLAALSLFGLIILNIYVAQGSFILGELQSRVNLEEARYRQMRYEVSLAQSPARLSEVAEKLGLVTPVHQETLAGPPRQEQAPPAPADRRAAGRNLKSVLAGNPGP